MESPREEPQAQVPVSAPFVDNLLNLIGNPVPKLSEMKVQEPSSTQSFDLLGSFDGGSVPVPATAPFSTGPAPDLLGGTQKLDILDDIFSNPTPAAPSNAGASDNAFIIGAPLRPNANQTEQTPAKAQAQPQKPSDPFSTFGNITSDWLGLSTGGSTAPNKPSSAPNTQRTSPSTANAPMAATTTPPMTSPKYPSTPVNQRTPNEAQPSRPDYSRLNFGAAGPAGPGANGQKPAGGGGGGGAATGGDIFGDILGSQGYSFASRPSNSTRSINAMRKEEMVKEMDPEKIKILEWVSGTEGTDSGTGK